MIAVLDYGIGNLRSAQKALEHLGSDAVLAASPRQARGARGVVLPGVGAFGRCLKALRESGLDKVALDAIDAGTPFLGICVGLQMIYEGSEEDPGARGLGVLEGTVKSIPSGHKRPQMQWNVLEATASGRSSPMLSGLEHKPWVYFVHSYAPQGSNEVVATCDYGGPVVAAVAKGSLWGTQFHPEKSGTAGLRLLANFVDACGEGRDGAIPRH